MKDTETTKGAPDYLLLALVSIAVLIGLQAIYSASFALAARDYGGPAYFVLRQALWALVGYGLLVFFMRFDYKRLMPLSPLIMRWRSSSPGS